VALDEYLKLQGHFEYVILKSEKRRAKNTIRAPGLLLLISYCKYKSTEVKVGVVPFSNTVIMFFGVNKFGQNLQYNAPVVTVKNRSHDLFYFSFNEYVTHRQSAIHQDQKKLRPINTVLVFFCIS
jgi:hypothetical protein